MVHTGTDAQPERVIRLGRPLNGVYLDLTGMVVADQPVSGTFPAAPAAGEPLTLGGRGRPSARLHLTDRAAGLAQLLEAVR
jgi:hypothetical protein